MSITTAFQSIALAAVASAAAAAEPQGNPERNAYPRPPVFLIVAAKEPDGANLDRIQVVKGWVQDGKPTEQIYNVAWSGDRQMDKGGKLPPVGNTVDANMYNKKPCRRGWRFYTYSKVSCWQQGAASVIQRQKHLARFFLMPGCCSTILQMK